MVIVEKFTGGYRIEEDAMDRIEDLLEDVSGLKAIEDRVSEPSEDYETYSRKRKSRLHI